MSDSNRWLLPDGIDEVLSPQAWKIEALRRQLLDLYRTWGYELVIPPYVEYLESLLTGVGSDLDLKTFKVMDQLTGRTMGIRADMTPQLARIDARSMTQQGTTRFCYAGSVLHTRASNMLSSRSPIQLGAEIYGCEDAGADIEVISLMVETLKGAGAKKIHLDFGHVDVYQPLLAAAALTTELEQNLFALLQSKAQSEIEHFVTAHVDNAETRKMLARLCTLHGDQSVISEAKKALSGAPTVVQQAIVELETLAQAIAQAYPEVILYFDLGELRGYQYHSGALYSAYVPGLGQAVAKGGRYDNIGKAFGRARPATGFSADLKALAGLANDAVSDGDAIWAPASCDPAAVSVLRAKGEIVVCQLGDGPEESRFRRRLVLQDEQWIVRDN